MVLRLKCFCFFPLKQYIIDDRKVFLICDSSCGILQFEINSQFNPSEFLKKL
jgi:hypothetical protein